MRLSIREARAAHESELFWSRMLVGAKFLKATSNVILKTVGAFNPAVNKIAEASELAQVHLERDGVGLARHAAKKAAGRYGEQAELAAEEIDKRIGIVVDAQKGELDGRSMTKYTINEHLAIAEKTAGQVPGGKKLEKVFKAAQSVNEYAFGVYALIEEHSAAEARGRKPGSAEKTLLNQLDRLNRKIDELEALVRDCEEPQLELLLSRSTDRAGTAKPVPA